MQVDRVVGERFGVSPSQIQGWGVAQTSHCSPGLEVPQHFGETNRTCCIADFGLAVSHDTSKDMVEIINNTKQGEILYSLNFRPTMFHKAVFYRETY